MGMGRLSGKVAFVTGGARGMGRAHATRLARDGADLIVADICSDFSTTSYSGSTVDDLLETERLIRAEGQESFARQVDVRDMAALQSLVDDGVARFGRLDIVVANAGINTAGRSWELSSDEWDEVVSVNLKGVWQTAKAAIPTLIRQGDGGVIIMTGSTAAVKGLPFMAHYAAAKHGVVGLTQSLAVELGEYNIRVVAVHPGACLTGLTMQRLHELVEQHPRTASIFMNTLPVDTLRPEDVAGVVAFLASDEAKYITGSEFRVEMGNLCR